MIWMKNILLTAAFSITIVTLLIGSSALQPVYAVEKDVIPPDITCR